jgi:hypothetical protein
VTKLIFGVLLLGLIYWAVVEFRKYRIQNQKAKELENLKVEENTVKIEEQIAKKRQTIQERREKISNE